MDSMNNKIEWPLVGNSHISGFLSRIIDGGDVSGTYIFSGPDNLGKTSTALFFSQVLLCEQKSGNVLPCNKCASCKKFLTRHDDLDEQMDLSAPHSDLYLIKKEKDKKNISIEQIRDFIRSLSMSSFLNSYKIGVIKHADALSENAFNALLKTLEEPREKVIVILITSDIELLPATIVSRSKVLRFGLVSSDLIYDDLINKHKASRSEAKNFSRVCLGRPALAVKFLEDRDFRDAYFERVDGFLKILNQNINERIMSVGEMIGSKNIGQENVVLAERIIQIWQGIARDLLLMEFNNKNLVQHEIVNQELEKTKIGTGRIINLMNSLKQGQKYLRANVNPKLVLENIVINI